jgi:hypothetical protein
MVKTHDKIEESAYDLHCTTNNGRPEDNGGKLRDFIVVGPKQDPKRHVPQQEAESIHGFDPIESAQLVKERDADANNSCDSQGTPRRGAERTIADECDDCYRCDGGVWSEP